MEEWKRETADRQRRAPESFRVIGELMLALGIKPHLRGYRPLCEGIRILSETDRTTYIPFGELKKMIGEMYRLPNAEHAMRDAIRSGFVDAGELHQKLFPRTPRPSNTQFLYTLAEVVRCCIASNGEPERFGLPKAPWL